ncbi:DUF2007 domain-containing protein [Niveibacterium sp. SC-1]|uniref:putative signal transducing protein n=1 Tax=Niveibacterium sp. SC-1 TaxID=3135646 RepID=UPI00311F3298
MTFVPVAVPQTESQLSVMVSLLEAHGIRHFVLNRGFGGLYPGMQIPLYNDQRVMVHEAQAADALELLESLLAPDGASGVQDALRLRDRLRVAAELLLGHWCFPTRRRTLGGKHESGDGT